ncbi:MAG TPA: amidohydrolase family protein [Candidatus Obscuribacterales bacterium]
MTERQWHHIAGFRPALLTKKQMLAGLYITDFHAHLRGKSNVLPNFCAEDQASEFFQQTAPVFERLARLSEPVHSSLIRWFAMNYRGKLHRHIYGNLAQFALMETLRLFKTYDVRCLLKSMDRNGIDRAIVCSLEPFITTQEILEAVAPHKDRILVFASVARNEPHPVQYLQKHIESGEIAGLKIHPQVGQYACNELYECTKDVVALATEYDLPILIHTGHIPASAIGGLANGCGDVRAVAPLVKAFPHAKIVLAHIGWESWRYILELAQQYKHVSVETSWQPPAIIRRALDLLGPHRVLFGSDFPLFHQGMALSMMRQAVTAREFVHVASTNATYILRQRYVDTTSKSA